MKGLVPNFDALGLNVEALMHQFVKSWGMFWSKYCNGGLRGYRRSSKGRELWHHFWEHILNPNQTQNAKTRFFEKRETDQNFFRKL